VHARHGIVLFDGTCAFCEGAVIFIARRDPNAYFRFGASQTAERSVSSRQGSDLAK
jgi:predicted DCC family thiol-disulfide oxidoreductase YuxK